MLVLGFLKSISLSIMRLMLIAKDLALTIAKIIQNIVLIFGKPFGTASNAPERAKGSAKTECSNFIKLRKLVKGNRFNNFFIFIS